MKKNNKNKWVQCLFFILLMQVFSVSHANQPIKTFDSTSQETLYHELINELRCPKCQNQNLAGSDSVIANNLKYKIYEMVKQGKDKQQIREFMIARYGDFISYKPPVTIATSILWFFPPLLLFSMVFWWFWHQSKRTKRVD